MAAATSRAPPLDMPLLIVPGPGERLNPGKWFDLSDSASFTCRSCRQCVCLTCGTTPAECGLRIFDSCNDTELAECGLSPGVELAQRPIAVRR